jgi:hypothetical protein
MGGVVEAGEFGIEDLRLKIERTSKTGKVYQRPPIFNLKSAIFNNLPCTLHESINCPPDLLLRNQGQTLVFRLRQMIPGPATGAVVLLAGDAR